MSGTRREVKRKLGLVWEIVASRQEHEAKQDLVQYAPPTFLPCQIDIEAGLFPAHTVNAGVSPGFFVFGAPRTPGAQSDDRVLGATTTHGGKPEPIAALIRPFQSQTFGPFGAPPKSNYVLQKEHEALMLEQTVQMLKEAREAKALAKGFGKGRLVSAAASSAMRGDSLACESVAQHDFSDSNQGCESDDSDGAYLTFLREEEAQRVANGGAVAPDTDSDEEQLVVYPP